MTTGSNLITFKQGLRAALLARAGLSGVAVSYGFPGKEIAAEQIWFGGATADTQQRTMRGGTTAKVDEDFRLTVYLQVLKSQSEGQEAADVRATALLVELQQELAETPQTIAGILQAELVAWEHVPGPVEGTTTTNGSRFEATVRVRARLA